MVFLLAAGIDPAAFRFQRKNCPARLSCLPLLGLFFLLPPLPEPGDALVVWKVGYSPSSTDVLSYEKDAVTSGGKVLLRNGTVKRMTAAEFKAASH